MQKKRVTGKEGQSLFELLREDGMGKMGFCGGKGRCGKCRVRVMEGDMEPSIDDRKIFTDEELMAGYRLSCTCYPVKGQTMVVELPDEGEILVETGYRQNAALPEAGGPKRTGCVEAALPKAGEWKRRCCAEDAAKPDEGASKRTSSREDEPMPAEDTRYGIAVDIGTTTIAMQLVGWKKDGTFHVLQTYAASNSQRSFGADVISRILAAQEGHAQKLFEMIHADIRQGAERLSGFLGKYLEENELLNGEGRKDLANLSEKRKFCRENGGLLENGNQLEMVLAMNTTMQHLFLKYDCRGLGEAPFRPFSVEAVKTGNMWLFPGSSAFIGGDIVAGLLACGFEKRKKPALFLDLGTNGEMVVGTKDGLLSASAAAGPAFEGGGMECGSPGIRGAVCRVSYLSKITDLVKIGKKRQNEQNLENGNVRNNGQIIPISGGCGIYVETIGSVPPCGICGTGMVDAAAALLEGGWLDETGLLSEELREEGITLGTTEDGRRIYISQKDIREHQMAKAAVRAGVDVLLGAYGCSYEELDQVYLAGGFGQKLSVESAVRTGLLPEELKEKTVAVGNTALYGAVMALVKGGEARDTACGLAVKIKEHTLANDPLFSEYYMKEMFF